jgi:flagellar protein FliS
LFHINAQNDLVALEEVKGLIQDVANAWQKLPSLLTPVNLESAPLRH